MNLLMLAFEFPPLGGVGVQRSLKFAKYLPEHGVRPVVVTPDKESIEAVIGPAREAALLDELPAATGIERVPCPPVRRGGSRIGDWLHQFFSLGEGLGRAWREPLLAAWPELVRREKPDALYVSVPPFSMAPLAVELAQRSGLPLILDFRDNWSQWCCSPQPSWLHYRLTLRRERACLDAASAVVGVTRQLVEDLQRAHPGVPAEKFHVVANGYDASLPDSPAARPAPCEKPFVIGYVGSFYYTPETRAALLGPWWQRSPHRWLQYAPRREDWLYRSPFFFFRALRRLLYGRPELRSRVKVRFVGDTPSWLRAQVEEFGLTDVVEHLGRMSHRACLEFQASCDALLATSAKVIGGRDYCIAGKTFEYVASRTPIIAFVTEGEQREFLAASGLAIVCDADEPEAGARGLAELIEGCFSPVPNLPYLRGFHRRETGRQMADLVRQVVDAARPVKPAERELAPAGQP
ncbi:MAG: glycosyltransferase family 4 protein [Verrucomicrobia bacterium]|nr:glycosyltransferase family 4 protein [Verrucomicrobiota bacterium]